MNPGHSLLGKRNEAIQSASLQGDSKNVSYPSNGVWKYFKITGPNPDQNHIVSELEDDAMSGLVNANE